VEWLGVRLGKTQDEITAFSDEVGYFRTNEYGFQKHACFQYSVFPNCFWVGIFHAVPYGAIDRFYLHQKMADRAFQEEFITEVSKVLHKGYEWISGAGKFALDGSQPTEELIRFYKANDREGGDTMMGLNIKCGDERIEKDRIIGTITSTIDDLYRLFALVVRRYK
jgi:hypothetical protein